MNSQTKLTILRFIGYLAVSCSSIAVPMLIYLITQDVKTAGIYVFIEWISKVFFYAIGGTFLNKFTLKASLIKADLLRIIGYIILLVSYLYQSTLLLPGIVIIQIGNGISNLIYERSVFLMWEDRLKGYSSIIKLDYIAVATAVIFGMILNSILPLVIFSLILIIINFLVNLYHGDKIFPKQEVQNISYSKIFTQTSIHFKEILKNKNILFLIIMSLSFATLLNMIFSSMSFFVENFDTDLSKNVRFISFLIAIKALLSSLSLHFLSYLKEKDKIKNHHYLYIGIFLWFSALITILLSKNLLIFLLGVFVSSIANSLITVWIRNYRIKYLDEEKRNEQISVIIALECCNYVISGLFLMFSKSFFTVMVVVNILLLVVLLYLLFKRFIIKD